jgi:pimeloyl-ACP methyl ester carboxylesterase
MRSDCSFVRTARGLRLAYVEQGEREGPAVVMLHGYTDSHCSFDLLRPHLPEAWRAIAVTARGHGRSDKPDAGYACSDMAGDVAAFLDALGVERAFIVGHSMGAGVALQTAAEHPERVAGLALIGAFAGFGGKAGVAELAAEVMRFEDEVDPDFALAFQESTFADPIPQGFLDTVIGESLRCPARVWKLALQGQLDSDSVAAARRCQAPALLIRGEHDAFVPHADQLKLRDALGSARIFTMRGVGHAPHWERPGETAALLTAFIAEVDGGDTGPAR